MENRFENMRCPNCGAEMEIGVTIQGYAHPLVWSPHQSAISYGDSVRLAWSKNEKLRGLRRFTSRFRLTPSYFPAWYCEKCGLMVVDTKTEMDAE